MVARVMLNRLVVESGDLKGMVYPLTDSSITIGRGPENPIQIIDTRLSRVHVRIEKENGFWTVEDLQSKNGTFVNNEPIAVRVKLISGDMLQVGDTQLVFESEPAGGNEESSSSGVKFVTEDGGLEMSHIIELPRDEDSTMIAAACGVPLESEARLKSIYQVGKLIQSILDLDELLDKLMGIVCQVLHPTHACIMLDDPKGGVLIPKVVHRPPESTGDLIISGSIIRQALDDRVAVVMEDSRKDKRFKKSESVARHRIRSAICAPLLSKDRVLGALYLDTRDPNYRFTDADLQWAVGIASQAAMAIEIAMMHGERVARFQRERELEIARSIQMNLLPKSMPKIKGFDFGGVSKPARAVGGDLYDIMQLPDGDIALAIVDVSGKGVPSAILLASVRSAVRSEARFLPQDGVLDVMTRLNQTIHAETMSNMFVSMVLGYFEPEMRRLTYCNAGHVYPILRTADGKLEHLESGGCFLGIMPGLELQKNSVKIPPGSMVVFITDGVVDAQNPKGEDFGQARLEQFVSANSDLSATDFCRKLEDEVTAFQDSAEQFDDLTVMVLKAH